MRVTGRLWAVGLLLTALVACNGDPEARVGKAPPPQELAKSDPAQLPPLIPDTNVVRQADGSLVPPYREKFECTAPGQCTSTIINAFTNEVAFDGTAWASGFQETGKGLEVTTDRPTEGPPTVPAAGATPTPTTAPTTPEVPAPSK